MSDFLMGKEVSGTPLETRGGANQIAMDLQSLISGGRSGVGRLTSQSQMSALGFDPSILKLGEVISRMLTSPADKTSGLFASLEPFEKRQTSEAVAGLHGSMGQMGGRWGRSALNAEALLRGELAGQQSKIREQSLLDANAQSAAFLANLLGAITGARNVAAGETASILDFFRPGQTQFQPGALGDIISAGGTLGAAKILA